MKVFAYKMKTGELRIEFGLNFVNATLRDYPNFDIESVIELDFVGTIFDYPEIKEITE